MTTKPAFNRHYFKALKAFWYICSEPLKPDSRTQMKIYATSLFTRLRCEQSSEQSIFVLVILRATGKVSDVKRRELGGSRFAASSLATLSRFAFVFSRRTLGKKETTALRFYICIVQDSMTEIVRVTCNLVAPTKLNEWYKMKRPILYLEGGILFINVPKKCIKVTESEKIVSPWKLLET